MNIQNIPQQAKVNFSANVTKPKKINHFNLNQADNFKPQDYNRESFAEELESFTDFFNSPLTSDQIETILDSIDSEPKKYIPLKNLTQIGTIKGDTLEYVAELELDAINIISEFANIKDKDGEPKYDRNDIDRFSTQPLEDLEQAKKLVDTHLSVHDIYKIINDEINIDKLKKNVLEIEKICDINQVGKVSFHEDDFEPDKNYFLEGTNYESGKKRSILMDKKLNRLAIEETSEYTSQSGKDYLIVKTNDFRNKTTSKVRYCYDDSGYPCVESQVRIKKDKDGKVLYTEYMGPSDVKGIYDAKIVYPDGRVEETSSGKIDPKTGIKTVKYNFKSLDGTKTQYLYEDDPQGNRIIDYKITDKNGKVLLDNSQTFEKINNNRFISSKNGKSYEIVANNRKKLITLTNQQTKEKTDIELDNYLIGDTKAMLKLLKNIPGEELIALKDKTQKLNGIKSLVNSNYDPQNGQISTTNELFAILHELGHVKDHKNKKHTPITGRKDIQSIYNKEKALFNKEFPNAQRDIIDYFINIENHYMGETGGLAETVAESNALLNSNTTEPILAARAFYLRQYFPKTIAKISEALNK